MKNKSVIVALIAIVVVVGVVAVIVANGKNDSKSSTASNSSQNSMSNMDMSSQSSGNSASSEAVATKSVAIKDFAFSPTTIKVKVGDTVTWTNQDSTEHNVVADDDTTNGPNGPLLAQGKSYSFTFKKAGTYAYRCSIHPNMQAKVIVE